MCFWSFLDFACECKENVRDKVYGCEHLVRLELHLLHATHLQVNLDVFGTSLFFLDAHDVCQRQQIKLRFSAKLRLHVFWSCMTFFNKFVENMNEFGCF